MTHIVWLAQIVSQFGERVNQSRYDLVDQLLKGQLARRLRQARRDRLSYDDLAAQLAEEGISVSRETLRRWTNDVLKKSAA